MPLFTARKELVAAQRLSTNEIVSSIAGLGVEWRLHERNAEGPELIVDGDMEFAHLGSDLVDNGAFDPLYGPELLAAAGGNIMHVSNWTAGASAILSNPVSGILRIEHGGGLNPFAKEAVLIIGKRYLITGETKSDGSASPKIVQGGQNIQTFVVSTNFESFSFEFTAMVETNINLQSLTATITEYTEWRNISITEVNPEWTLGDGWSIGSALNQLVDGDMEASGTGDWEEGNSATLTKEAGARTGGSGTQIIKVARNGLNNPYIFENDTNTIGKKYRATGWYRSDGNATIRIADGPIALLTDGNSTLWTFFDLEFVATAQDFFMQSVTLTGTEYTEWDDVSITEVETAHCDGTQVAVTDLTQDILTVGKTYEISWDVFNYQAGNVAALAGTAISSLKAADGSYTEQVLAVATTVGGVQGDADFLGDVDNVVITEVITLTNWTDGNDAELTKETSDPYEDLQSLRIERDGTNDPYAAQAILTVGKRYLVNARAKSDGAAVPRVFDTGVLLAAGTADTFYQEFDFEFTATTTEIRFESQTSVGTEFTEWDDVSVVELIPEGGGSVAKAVNPPFPLGRDLITEGAFPNDPGVWTLGAAWTIAGGKAVYDDIGTNAIYQGVPIQGGATYELTFDISDVSSGTAQIGFYNEAGSVNFVPYAGLANGSYTRTFTSPSTETTFAVYGNTASGSDWKITNVTLKQIDILPSIDYPGDEELVDGDMEASGVGDWTAINDANLTKETGTRTGGSGTQILRITRDGVDNPNARQSIRMLGQRDRITGWARSDGSAIPEAWVSGVRVWLGTASTDWQYFDVENVASTILIALVMSNATGTEYTEWDDVSVTEVNPLHGDSEGVIIGQDAGAIGLSYYFNSVDAFVNILSAELNSIFNSENGGAGTFVDMESAAWTDGIARYLLYLYVDSDNFIAISKSTVDDSLLFQVKMGGVERSVTVEVCTDTGYLHVFVTWRTEEVVIFINGLVVAVLMGIDIWVGNLILAIIGALALTPTNVHYGWLSRVQLWVVTLTTAQVAAIANSGRILPCSDIVISGASGFSSGFSSGFE